MNEQIMKHFVPGLSEENPDTNYFVEGRIYHITPDKLCSFWEDYLKYEHDLVISEIPHSFSPVIIDCSSQSKISIEEIIKMVDLSVKEIDSLICSDEKMDYKCHVFEKMDDNTKLRLYFTNFSIKTKVIQNILIEKLRTLISSGTNWLVIEKVSIPETIHFFDKKGGYTLQGTVNKSKFKRNNFASFTDANKYKSGMNFIAYDKYSKTNSDSDLQAVIFSIKNRKERKTVKSSIKIYPKINENVTRVTDYSNMKNKITQISIKIGILLNKFVKFHSNDLHFIQISNDVIRGLKGLKNICEKNIGESIRNNKRNFSYITYVDENRDFNIFIHKTTYVINNTANLLLMHSENNKIVYDTFLNDGFSKNSLKDVDSANNFCETINKKIKKNMKGKNILVNINPKEKKNNRIVEIENEYKEENIDSGPDLNLENTSDQLNKNSENMFGQLDENSENIFGQLDENSENMFGQVDENSENMFGQVDENSENIFGQLDENSENMFGQVDENSENMFGQVDENSENMFGQLDENSENMSDQVDENSENMSVQLDENSENMSVQLDENSENMSVQLDENSENMSDQVDENSENMSDQVDENLENVQDTIILINRRPENLLNTTTDKKSKKIVDHKQKVVKFKIWIDNHVKNCEGNCIPKDELYNFYTSDCDCVQNCEKLSYTLFLREFPTIVKQNGSFNFFASKRIVDIVKTKKDLVQCYLGIDYVPHL